MFRHCLTLSLIIASSLSAAADPVTDAMQAAYAPYRAALFKTSSGSQTDAQQAITQAQQSWRSLSERFGSKPPAPYDRDAGFGESLAGVTRIYDAAATEIARNDLAAAHETLEAARDTLAELRQRNNVVVFSDHMNAYHAQMETVLGKGGALAATADGRFELGLQAGALDYLATRLGAETPTALRANTDFQSLLGAVQTSVRALKDALRSQDAARIQAALAQLKAPYSKLFVRFG
jgi:hypothetical protein